MKVRFILATLLSMTLTACGASSSSVDGLPADSGAWDGDGAPEVDRDGAPEADGDGGQEIECPVSDSGIFEDLPSGACLGAGSCAVELDNSCRPGVSVVPTTRTVFECRCISDQWDCIPKSGGLGLRSCDDAG